MNKTKKIKKPVLESDSESEPEPEPKPKPHKIIKKIKKPIIESDSESEPEKIIIKKLKEKKPTVIEVEESETESEEKKLKLNMLHDLDHNRITDKIINIFQLLIMKVLFKI